MPVVSNFLETLDAQAKQRIKDKADTLVSLLEEWVRPYPCIRTTRIPMTSLTTAVALPRLSIPDALTTAKMILWAFAVDDKGDEQLFTLDEMRYKSQQWYSIAQDGSGYEIAANDELTMMLLEIKRKLAKSCLFESLQKYWASRLHLIVQTMVQEYQDALGYNVYGACALPSLDEYVRNGTHSIGFPLWGSTVLILLRDPSVVKRLEAINQATEYAGATIRLYNDVRTFERENQEKRINSITITYHEMLAKNSRANIERILSEAKQHILQLARSHAQKCREALKEIQTSSRQFEEATSKIIALHAYFYGYSEYDYHTTSQSQIHGWLDSVV